MEVKVQNYCISIREDLILENNRRVKRDLKDYLNGKKVSFDYKINLNDFKEFEKKIFQEIRKIPYGKTLTYRELAEKVGRPKAYRAIGNICGKNPTPIIIPCHRVVGKNSLGGYFYPLEVKYFLLNLEKSFLNNKL